VKKFWQIIFGAKAQIVMGILFLVAVVVQWFYWTVITQPTVVAVFHISMEALAFAAYAIIATALGYRATERVETAVVENIENADTVNVEEN
jgi:membrane protein implicated in regulation of membrane protease activity